MGLGPIGVDDDFFELNGHSLMAVQIIAQIKQQLKVAFPVGFIYDNPTIAKLAGQARLRQEAANRRWRRAYEQPEFAFGIIGACREGGGRRGGGAAGVCPALFLVCGDDAGDTANNQSALLIEGDLQPELLEKALNCLIHRHSSLRMAFSQWTPVQQCRAFHGFDLSVLKLDGCGEEARRRRISDISARFMAQPFVLDKPPHLRAQLFQLQSQRYLLLLCMPHIIADGGAFHLFEQQLWQVYSALNAGRTRVTIRTRRRLNTGRRRSVCKATRRCRPSWRSGASIWRAIAMPTFRCR